MPGLPDERVPEPLHRLALDILHDEDDAAAAIVAGPTRQDRRHVDHVLHAVNDHRMFGVFRQRNEALDPKQLRPCEERRKSRNVSSAPCADRPVAGQAEGMDAGVVPVHVVMMVRA